MKAVEEPAYLSVGTDVSAKYRGAFCEAKIKTVKRLVKVKVTLKGESTSQVVHDDQVKGPLRVGSTVEVKNGEGGCSEAVISKLTDASLYTVVFDDGDEKTLRRTSLCLKGERHFAESETLDQLPLTNPEHFGTPVIGKKSNRGRRSSQAVADEENESSSSEEEEDDRRVTDELLGKVCSTEGEPSLVLVLSPVCNEELVVKKDHCLVRSFADGKFSTVLRRNLHSLTSSSICKPELSSRKGVEAAQSFLRTRTVPEVWKMDLSQILESSSDDEEEKPSDEEQEEEQEQEDKKKRIRDEPEEEADPEERDHFLQQLYKFMEDRGTPINKPPVLGYKDLNLFKLFRLVNLQGGCNGIEAGTIWKQIYMDLGIPVLNSAAAYNVKTAYKKYLFGFEEYCRSALITFRTIHHNNPRPPASPANQRAAPETKTGSPANQRAAAELKSSPAASQRPAGVELKDAVKMEAESDSDSDKEAEERHASPRGRRRCVLPVKDKRSTDSEEQRDARKRTPRQTDQSERGGRLTDQSERGGRLTDQSERGGRLTDQSESSSRLPDQSERGGRFTDQSERGSEDEEDEEEEEEDEEPQHTPADRSEEDPDGDSITGTKVRVKYGRGKTQKIYEAHIKKTDVDNGEFFYLVHYYGWNVRYDEWVKADRIIWPTEKGSKKKQRRKLKNKDEPDREEERPVRGSGGRRGRPLGSKNKTNGRPSERRAEPGPHLANGDNTPRRRTRRTSGMYDSDRASNEDSGNSSDDSESEDSTEKKPFPWRRQEACPKQEVDMSPKQEEEEHDQSESGVNTSEPAPENTATSETTAPSIPQDTAPSQSEQGEEPEQQPQVAPDQKDPPSAHPPPPPPPPPPPAETSPKLKLLPSVVPLMVLSPRPEPMVLLHHCLPPDSDTDSASENDGSDDDKEDKEDTDGEGSPNQLDRNMNQKSPLKDKNISDKATVKDKNISDKILAKDRNIEKNPLKDKTTEKTLLKDKTIIKSPLRDKNVSERNIKPDEPEIVKSPIRQDKNEGEKCLKSDQNEGESTPKEEKNEGSRTPVKHEKVQAENPSKQDETEAQRVTKSDKSEGEKTPLKRKAPEQRSPEKKLRTETESSPKTTNMAAEEQRSNAVKEEGVVENMEETVQISTTEEEVGEKTAVLEEESVPEIGPEALVPEIGPEALVPEIGPEALVCHEVDLDEPDEREKAVAASEQLMLMSHLAHLPKAPPTPAKAPPTPVKALPTAAFEQKSNCTEEKETERGHTGGHEDVNSSPASNSSNCDRGQKRLMEDHHSPSVKKHKRHSHKRPTPHKTDKNGAGHSSDSEDQTRVSVKTHKHCPSPTTRGHKWTLHIDDLEKMSPAERISFLQEKLQEIRKYYMSLKSEVASIDRRRKRLKKKEREVSNTASASSSSDAGMSPSSSSPSQSSLAVEVR